MDSYIIRKEQDLTIAEPIIDKDLPTFQDIDSATVFGKVSGILPNGGQIFIKNAGPTNPYVMSKDAKFRQSNLIIKSDFATIKAGSENVVGLTIGRPSSEIKINQNVIIEGIAFDGNYPVVPNGACLYVAACDNVDIRDCIFKNTGIRDAVKISVWSETEYRKNSIDICKCNFINASMSLGGIDSGSIYNCLFQGGTFAEFSILDISFGEQNNSIVRNFNIYANKFIGINTGNRVISGFQRAEDVWISNNIFRDCTVAAIQSTTTVSGNTVLSRRRIHVNNNKFINCQKAIEIHAEDSEIIGNIANNITDNFIVSRGPNSIIANNRAKSANRYGIIVFGYGTKILGNYLEDMSLTENRQYYRIDANVKNCDIIGNTAKCTGAAKTDAFYEAAWADYNFFTNNRIEGNFINKYIIKGLNSTVYTTFRYTPQNVDNVSVGISPFSYTNNDHYPEDIQIVGGNISSITLIRNNIQTNLGITNGIVLLEPKDAITVVYTVVPTMRKMPH